MHHPLTVLLLERRGNDQIDHRFAHHIVSWPTEHFFSRWIEFNNRSPVIDGDNSIEGRFEDCRFSRSRTSYGFVATPTLNKLPDLNSNRSHHAQQIVVGLANLSAEELNDTVNLRAQPDRESDGGMQSFFFSDVSAREIGVMDNIRDPSGAPRWPIRGPAVRLPFQTPAVS